MHSAEEVLYVNARASFKAFLMRREAPVGPELLLYCTLCLLFYILKGNQPSW